MPRGIRGIADVAERQLCTGCGACAFAQPDAITMVDDLDAGRRPIVGLDLEGRHLPTVQALAACPGTGLAHGSHRSSDEIAELRPKWGPVLEVWEGYAGDEQIRVAGSSGGVASALAVHCIEREHMHGLLHIRGRDDVPYLNETVLSTSRADILAATGSRYAPASPCDRLELVTSAPAPCVFIGKPCDVAATSLLRATRPDLDEKLGLTIAIFCAGTPTTRGTLEMLGAMGIEDPEALVALRYRGNGWPGDATAHVARPDGSIEERRLSYDESWGEVLQRHRQWRCYVCADHTGEFADIAVGDPWYREIEPEEPGRSLILVRTERGRDLLARALAAGTVAAHRVDASLVPRSQPGLVMIRGAVGGRIATLRLVGLPAPRFVGLPMLGTWLRELSLRAKLRSTLGTLRRVRRRSLHRRVPVRPAQTDPQERAS
jgi:coenzyme F420 hydrogenase subunit beta